MSFLKSKIFHKITVTILALIIVLAGIYAINKKLHISPELEKLTGQVEGIFIADKFLDSIPAVIPASAAVTSPYQDVQGNVAISGTVSLVSGSNYNALSLADNTTDATPKGALITGARKTNANAPFTAFGTWDSGTAREIFIGGGGWGKPDATSILLYTAPAYNETTNQGVVQMSIENDGDIKFGPLNSPGTGGTMPGYGSTLWFQGGPTDSSRNSNNSDAIWMSRYNAAADNTQLRINNGDDGDDVISFGYTSYQDGQWKEQARIGGGGPPLRLRNTYASSTSSWDVGPDNSQNNFVIYKQSGPPWGVYLLDGSTSWASNSDRRIKTNIQALSREKGLEAIQKLNPVTFNWLNNEKPKNDQLGFIAQDVQEIFPELVSEGPDAWITHSDGTKENISKPLGVNFDGLIAPIVKAIQELAQNLLALTKRVDSQEQKIQALQQEVNQLKQEILLLKQSNR